MLNKTFIVFVLMIVFYDQKVLKIGIHGNEV